MKKRARRSGDTAAAIVAGQTPARACSMARGSMSIVTLPLDLLQRHAPLDAADQGTLFVLRKIMAGRGAPQNADFGEGVLDLGGPGDAVITMVERMRPGL